MRAELIYEDERSSSECSNFESYVKRVRKLDVALAVFARRGAFAELC